MSAESPHLYEFGNFRLDTKEKTLYREHEPIALRPKVFETLQVFVEHPGRLLEKDELMEKIWKDQFVEETNLTFNIKVLRRILNDDAHNPRFIETVPRRGYRFIAEVKPHFNHLAAKAEAVQPMPAAKSLASRHYLWIGALVLLLATAVSIAWFTRSNRASTASVPVLSATFKSTKIINPGPGVRATITPDGKYVAYTVENGGKQSIWLRQLETAENI